LITRPIWQGQVHLKASSLQGRLNQPTANTIEIHQDAARAASSPRRDEHQTQRVIDEHAINDMSDRPRLTLRLTDPAADAFSLATNRIINARSW
jgi:hypothetical protein